MRLSWVRCFCKNCFRGKSWLRGANSAIAILHISCRIHWGWDLFVLVCCSFTVFLLYPWFASVCLTCDSFCFCPLSCYSIRWLSQSLVLWARDVVQPRQSSVNHNANTEMHWYTAIHCHCSFTKGKPHQRNCFPMYFSNKLFPFCPLISMRLLVSCLWANCCIQLGL